MNGASAIDTKEKGYFRKILLYSIPIMLTGLLQQFYNAADLIVVGHFESELAVGAIGSTGALTNLILGVFMGLAVGAGVSVAHSIGARQEQEVQNTLHTSVVLSVLLGVIVGLLGFIFAPYFLRLMGTTEDLIDMATLYIKIIFLGAPGSLLYNFCASMLRSAGDSKRPLIFLAISGLINVGLNLLLVAVFGMGIAGVAIGTIASQYASALFIMIYFLKTKGPLNFSFSKLRIHRGSLMKILRIGIPSGIQGSMFSLSNVVIQSSVNSLGTTVVSASAASSNLEGFYYIAYNSFYHAALTFVGQSVGAKEYFRIKKIVVNCLLNLALFTAILTPIGFIFKDFFLGLYITDNPEVFAAASQRYLMLAMAHCLCGLMDVANGAVRGLGRSVPPAVISLTSVCVLRVVWAKTVFKYFHTPPFLYIVYPISWIAAAIVMFIYLIYSVKKDMAMQKMYSLERTSYQNNTTVKENSN